MNAYELGNNWNIWCEYVDPGCCFTREEWDAMTEEERETNAQMVIDANA